MPLANLTALCNLALDHLGEPYLTAYETDTGTTAEAVRVHLPQALETCLDSHDWVFATRWENLVDSTGSPPFVAGWLSIFNVPANVQRVLRLIRNGVTLPNDYHIQSTWLYLPGAAGQDEPRMEYIANDVLVTRWPAHFADAVAFLLASRLAPKLTNNPALADSFFQKHEISLAKARKQEAISLHARQNIGEIANLALDLLGRAYLTDEDLNRGVTYDVVTLQMGQAVKAALDSFPWTFATRFATLVESAGTLPGWQSRFTLPDDCQRILSVEANDYHVQGGFLYLLEENAPAPVLHFIDGATAESNWSPLFKDAVILGLASRIAPKLSADPNLSTALQQKYELALAKARRQNAIDLHAKQNLGEIENMALDLLGRSYLTDEDITAGITHDTVRRHYDQVIESAMAEFPWSFATRFATLVASAGTLPGWLGRYALPGGCVRLLHLKANEAVFLPNDFHVENGYVYTPEVFATPPRAQFVSTSSSCYEWSPLFKDAVISGLAARLAPKLSADPNISAGLLQRHAAAVAKARAQDAIDLHARQNVGDIGNQALDLLGRFYLTDQDITRGITYDVVRRHQEQCKRTLLEGHVWSFATRNSRLTAASVDSVAATATLEPSGINNGIELQAVTPGPSGNEIAVTVASAVIGTAVGVSVTGNEIVATLFQTPNFLVTAFAGTNNDLRFTQKVAGTIPTIRYIKGNGFTIPSVVVTGSAIVVTMASNFGVVYETADAVKQRIDANPAAAALISVSFPPGNDGTGSLDLVGVDFSFGPSALAGGGVLATANDVVEALTDNAQSAILVTAEHAVDSNGTGTMGTVPRTALTGGDAFGAVFAPAYGSAFLLPTDCVRVILIDGQDIDIPRNDFEIQGRYLLLHEPNAESPVVRYITSNPPESEWPATFKEALITALAVKLAGRLSLDPNLSAMLMNRHEVALGKARSKDTRETRSKENHGPRQMAARSGLVRARYGNPLPPY